MKNKFILPSVFLVSVLFLTACAEKTDKESLNDNYESILTEDEASKYNKGKEVDKENEKRISFLKDEEYRANFEIMIANYYNGYEMIDNYYDNSKDSLQFQRLINYFDDIRESANYIEKFDTKRVPEEELELLYELKILAVNIKKSIETNEAIIKGDKLVTSGSYDSFITESEDRIKILENQYLKTLSEFETFLDKKYNATIEDYINKKIEFKEEK